MRMDEHIKRLIEKYTLEASRMSGEEALERYEMAYSQAKELGNAFTIRACAANLGAAYISFGKKKEAQEGLEYLSEATPPEGVSDCVSNGDLYFNMGLGNEIVGLFERAYITMERAWEEYRSERDNLSMEISALKKLVQLSQVRQRYEDAVRWCQQLEESYGQAQRPVDQMVIMQQRTFLQERLGRDGFSEAVEQCQRHVDDIRQQGKATVGILVQMSVMLTHFRDPEAAREYLEEASSLLGVEHSASLEKAVVLQNLGTLCNYLDDWEASLPYHQQAAAIYQHYASLPPDAASPIQALAALKCQGHCFANHGYALVRLDDVDEARVLFNKAVEVATQSGDLDTKWQMEEALGAVHFRLACHDYNLPSPRDASLRVRLPESRMKHLKKSLDWYKLAVMDLASAPKGTAQVQDRVLEKYTLVKNFKDNASLGYPGQSPIVQEVAIGMPTEGAPQASSGDTKESADERQEDEEEEVEEEETEGEDSDDEESEEDSSSTEEAEAGNTLLGKTMHSPGDEDEDREQVNALYQAQLGDRENLQGTDKLQTIQADVHRRRTSSSAESGSSETDEDESEEEEEEEEEEKGRQVPPLPTQSPPVTMQASGTYENPKSQVEMEINKLYGDNSHSRPRPGLHGSTNYAEIDFDTKQGRSGELVYQTGRRARPNFFISSSDEESAKKTKRRDLAGPSRAGGEDPDYEPIDVRPTTPPGRPAHRSKQSEEPVNFEMGGSYLTHGQEKQKDSKTCSIM